MKKMLIGAAAVLIVGGYLWWGMRPSSSPTVTTSAPSESTNPGTSPVSGTNNNPTPTPTPTPVVTGFKDGSYTGKVVNMDYGLIQVAVTITGGKITAITTPQLPHSGGHTGEVTSVSIPLLKQEAITAQSAQVNIVSGATQTSEAFQTSLASALAQAS